MNVTREELRAILLQLGELLQRADLSRYQVGWQIRWLAEHLWQETRPDDLTGKALQSSEVPYSKWYEDWLK